MGRAKLLLVALLVAGCAPPRPGGAPTAPSGDATAPTRQKVVVYSPHGREMLDPFEQRFEAEHPDIDLETLDMGAQEVLDRLRAEKANPYADIWWGAPHTMFIKAARDGLLEAYQPSWSAEIAPARRDANHFWYGQYLTPIVIVFNSEALTAQTAPQDWDELLTPEWAQKILIRNPVESGTMRTFFAAMILRQADEAAGFAWLEKLDVNTKDYPANPALLYRQLAKREGLVTVWVLRDAEIQKRVNGYQLGYVIPRSGCPVIIDGIALVKSGRNHEAAKRFYEYVTARPQLLWAAEQFDTMPARQDIDRAALPQRMPQSVPEMKLDWNVVEAKTSGWMDHWTRTVRGDAGGS
ncbi:MAG: extracellular solute-binding protein [Armatimonadetes bacterium]|nr:extracellular solute-binding protein [Armatimonadota bacterium]